MTNLHGLNVVLPAQDSLDSQDLLHGHSYPDISAQLALWIDLPFDSAESPVLHSAESASFLGKVTAEEAEEEQRQTTEAGKSAAIHDGHTNVVTGTSIATAPPLDFNLNHLLSGFGGDYAQLFSQQNIQQQQVQAPPISPSLAQLLLFSASHHPTPPQSSPSVASDESLPPAKRARTRKASFSAAESPSDSSGVPLSASEDKRRRNTAASARFRMKKKEREAALEGRTKELEQRVNELERQCEGLRRENGWLKGLVVGVTGAAQGTSVPAMPSARAREDEA